MDERIKPRVEGAYDHAQRYLCDLFGLEPKLKIAVCGTRNRTLNYDVFYNGRLVECSSMETAAPLDAFSVGHDVGTYCYKVRNPEHWQQAKASFKRQLSGSCCGMSAEGIFF